MEFTVKRSQLLDELNLVQGVIEKKSTIPILSNILLESSGDRLNITATDLDVSICCGCAAVVSDPGTMTVPARRLFEIARYLPEEAEIHCTLLENDWLGVRSGNSEYKVVGLPKENFPSVPQPAAPGVQISGAVLKAMIQRTIFAITQEESRYSLNGAMLLVKPQEMRMVATDGHRLAVVSQTVDVSGLDTELKALIPRKTLIEVQKLIGDRDLTLEFGRDENHLFFSLADKRLVSRVLAGQFPNYEMVIPRANDKMVLASTKALADGIRRAQVMSDERLRAVRLSFKPNAVEITASSAEAGEARDVVPVEYSAAGMDIGFNPQYLLDFLSVCGSESVNLALRDSETQGMFRPAGDSKDLQYTYVVMPMKF